MTDSKTALGSSAGGAARTGLARREIWTRLLLYPTHTLPTAAAPVLVALGLAVRHGVFAPLPVLLAFLGSWLIHIAGVFIDNHELLRRHPGQPEHPELLDALARGTLSLGTLRVVIASALAAGLLCGIYPVVLGGAPALLIGAIGVLASVSYAGGPLAYARTGLAEPVFFLMFGVVAVFGAYYVQAVAVHGTPLGAWQALLRIPGDVLVAGLPVGALVTGVLIIDDIRDVDFDAAKGWRTGAVRFGIRSSRLRFVLLYAAAFLAPVGAWCLIGAGWPILLPLLAAPLAVPVVRAVCTRRDTPGLLAMTPRASMLALAYAALLAIGLAAA